MLEELLLPGTTLTRRGTFFEVPLPRSSDGLTANATYFGNTQWAREYLNFCHRDVHFRGRWLAAIGDWTDKVVVDLGCGPGNVFATLGGKPKLLIGVDVAGGSLELASAQGYTAVRADAAQTPFRSDVADIVVINASLHHCDDMGAVLREGARLVKPGGLLVTDHDPQLTAWDYQGLAKMMWNFRLWVYRVTRHSFHRSRKQQFWGLRTEVHHRPGDGVSEEFFKSILEPLGFDVNVYAHNHQIGENALKGIVGPAQLKYKIGNILSGRRPSAKTSALSLMCIARRAEF